MRFGAVETGVGVGVGINTGIEVTILYVKSQYLRRKELFHPIILITQYVSVIPQTLRTTNRL